MLDLPVEQPATLASSSLEEHFDAAFAAGLALREKQIQQNYRPIIGVHKWFARRPGTLFRNLLLAEFNGAEPLRRSFFKSHKLQGVIADPFMGGGTPLIEANRLGFHVVGTDINPMAFWVVRQELGILDDRAFVEAAKQVAEDIESQIGPLYKTLCVQCGKRATAKYFLWVKTQTCSSCGTPNDLFPGYLLAEATRHPKHVIVCSDCQQLVELDYQPRADAPAVCPHCGGRVQVNGPARRNKIECRHCQETLRYPDATMGPPQHRMWAIEYHCPHCKPHHSGRFFKMPSLADLGVVEEAARLLGISGELPIPEEAIPDGDETNRLHRWGYKHYREVFNDRQLLGLGLLHRRIREIENQPVQHALLTVFSDILRYQNMLCRYDTYALKCQDIFSVHGFPVGLVQCENNVLGIHGVGTGGFRHFIEKYRRAKDYCRQPFETEQSGRTKRVVPIAGETIKAELTTSFPNGQTRQASIKCAPAASIALTPNSLDGVFTDPPYFANVQYAELIDFCYVWLRKGLRGTFAEFTPESTRSAGDLTGNTTLGRGLEHFTESLSDVFRHYAAALKPGSPFVFTYHHNDPSAYAPIMVALLDARLFCTAVLPAPGEMEASLHINNTVSSILDSVFVSRHERNQSEALPEADTLTELLRNDCLQMAIGGVHVSAGDARCLFSGHMARLGIQHLFADWNPDRPTNERLEEACKTLHLLAERYD
jgi:putative DNA methylase